MQVATRRSRVGFTLIELLMVIMIIGLMAGLGTRAAFQAMQKAKQAAIIAEISQLDMALGDYKTLANGYPPCMADVNATARQSRFFTHVTRAFPRYTAAGSFSDMQAQVITNFGGTLQSGNTKGWYDLNTMDQAESLVFWLSGFPTPRSGNSPGGSLMGSSKMMGFCAVPTAPFYAAMGNPVGVFSAPNVLNGIDKRPIGFAFDEGRLVDQDSDGWLEYLPVPPTPGTPLPPYVYYDSDLYTSQSTGNTAPTYTYYPNSSVAQAGPLGMTTWGYAMPYAAAVPASTTVQMLWINPRKFQIICAGLDNLYGIMGTSVTQPTFTYLPKIYPDGINFDPSGADLENLTNFSDRKLGDAVQ